MALEDYKRKRDFTRTPEPPPEVKKKNKGDKGEWEVTATRAPNDRRRSVLGLMMFALLLLAIGVVAGFLLGKRASTWCPGCGAGARSPAIPATPRVRVR